MKFVETFESLINQVLLWLYHLLVPNFVHKKCTELTSATVNFTQKTIQYTIKTSVAFASTVPEKFKRLIDHIRALVSTQIHFLKQRIPFKKSQEEPVTTSTQITKKSSYKLTEKLTYFFNQQLTRFDKLPPAKKLVLTLTLTIGAFASLSLIVQNTLLIIQEQNQATGRNLASFFKPAEGEIPSYYQYKSKSSLLTQLQVPAYVKDATDFKQLNIHMSITFNTQTAKQIYETYEHEFIDHIIMTIEEMPAKMNLTEEGKDILNKKILDEINFIFKDKMTEDGEKGSPQAVLVHTTYLLAN